MSRFILLSFAFLGWGFYEISGGADFKPAPRQEVKITTPDTIVTTVQPASKPNTPGGETILVASNDPVVPVPTVKRDLTQLLSKPTPTPVVQSSLADPATPSALTEPKPAPEPIAAPVEPPRDLREVRPSRVNMRGGPGTQFGVLAKVSRGQQVVVLREPGNGWAKLRVVETGRIGWIATSLLKKVPPQE